MRRGVAREAARVLNCLFHPFIILIRKSVIVVSIFFFFLEFNRKTFC